MSRTSIIPFVGGIPQSGIDFSNAWGGLARIWEALFKAHIPKKSEFDSWIVNVNDGRLWALASNPELSLFERAVHVFTFDLFYVRNEHFVRFANDLRMFAKKYPTGGVDHLPAWAKWLDDNSRVEAIGLYATSVSENLWSRQKKCPHCESPMDEWEPVPLDEGTEVYDWLEEP